jgi:hypothetical protein
VINGRDGAAPPAVAALTLPSSLRTEAAPGPAIASLPPNFVIGSAPTAQTVTAGWAAIYAISIQPIRGFTDPVSLSVDLPVGTLGTFSPNPATTSSTLTVTTSGATPGGSNLLAVIGTSGIIAHRSYLTLTIPDFSLSASPSSQTVATGSSTTYTVTIQPASGFSGAVTLAVDGLPSGATGTFNPNPTATSSVLSVNAACSMCHPGAYLLTITGVGGVLVHTTFVTLILGPPPPPPPPPDLCGAPPNPWGYNFCGGSVITSPPLDFCTYFACIPSFWTNANGYVEECIDGLYSHSGGRSGSCSSHQGNWRPLLSP